MTAIVGVLCKDGVVIGADSSTTFSAAGAIRTIEQKTRKIYILENRYIIAGTGQVGLGQRFIHEVEKHIAEKTNWQHGTKPVEFCRKIAKAALDNFITTNVKSNSYGALLAFPLNKENYLCEFAANDFQPELKNDSIWYVSMGGGQLITDPFLAMIRKLFWKDGMPSLQQGIFMTLWTLQHVVDINAGGIDEPIDIAILDNSGKAKFLSDEEIQEHLANIKALEEHISLFDQNASSDKAKDLPAPPLVSSHPEAQV